MGKLVDRTNLLRQHYGSLPRHRRSDVLECTTHKLSAFCKKLLQLLHYALVTTTIRLQFDGRSTAKQWCKQDQILKTKTKNKVTRPRPRPLLTRPPEVNKGTWRI